MMYLSNDLDLLLSQAMLDQKDARVRLVQLTKDNPMPFGETNKNLVLAAIRKLHAADLPVDVITVCEVLEMSRANIELSDIATIANAPLDRPLIIGDIIIRPFSARDLDEFVTAFRESVATVGAWLPWCHSNYSEIEAVGWFSKCKENIATGHAYDLGIFSRGKEELLGGVAINQINRTHKIGNLGYWVREARQRQGIAVQATRRMIDFGFKELALTRLEIAVAEDNLASRRLAERVGGTLECISPNRLIIHGQPRSAAVYSLIPETA